MSRPADGISIKGTIGRTIRFGFTPRDRKSVLVETPVQLRDGVYDVEQIGAFTYLGGGSSVFRHIKSIGRFCLISRDISAGSVEHPPNFLSAHPVFSGRWEADWPIVDKFYRENSANVRKVGEAMRIEAETRFKKITIGSDVWIGEGAMIRRGVNVGHGAIIAARAFVDKDVEPYSIVGGIPAKKIRMRFPDEIVKNLLQLSWWDYGLSALAGVDFTRVDNAIDCISANIASGRAEPYTPKLTEIGPRTPNH